MLIAIVGGGESGRAIRDAIESRGASTRMLSPSTGFNALRDDAARAFDGAEAVVDAAGRFTLSRSTAMRFFTNEARAVASGSRAAATRRHVLLSIIACDRPLLDGYGYLAAKAAQERVTLAEREDAIIVRSAQWFEFAEQNLRRMRFGPIAAVPLMRLRPVALSAVAELIAACALGEQPGTRHEIAGPEITTLWRATRQLRKATGQRLPLPVPVPMPGRWGRAFRQGELLPAPGAHTAGPSLPAWLRDRPASAKLP